MFEHAKQRALERYNREFDDSDLKSIAGMIKNQNHIPLGCSETDKYRKFCYLKYCNIPYKVLYRNKKGNVQIITIYPLDVDEYNAILDAKMQERIQKKIDFLKSKGYIVYKRKK